MNKAKTFESDSQKKIQQKSDKNPVDALLDFQGVSALIQIGLNGASEHKAKNRIILGLIVALSCSLIWNCIQTVTAPEPRLLGETPDGRIRPLPLLSDPLFSHREILAWSDKCVQKIYNLSYVDWKVTIQNETLCLSDKARSGFADSLKKIGVLQYLTPEMQGTMHAITGTPVIRKARLSEAGYTEWYVDVPYKILVDGRQRGAIEVVMTMRVRRVSLTWREEGIWVDSYTVTPKAPGA